MDESLQPCIVQALPAKIINDKEIPTDMEKGSTSRRDRELPANRDTGGSTQQPSSSRRTRSQAAPDWTVHETLILVSEVAATDEDWLKALSSYQKWKIVSDNCIASNVMRSSNQCKRRWESIFGEYRSIRNWESKSRNRSYWSLQSNTRQKYGLPALFDQEVFDAMDAVIRPLEAPKGEDDSDSEDLVDAAEAESLDDVDYDLGKETHKSQENVVDPQDGLSDLGDNSLEKFIERSDIQMDGANADPGHDHEQEPNSGEITTSETLCPSERKTHSIDGKSATKAKEMASKLEEDAQRIHAILRGEITGNACNDDTQVDVTNPSPSEIEFTRRQADELIKAFTGLSGTLHQFSELILDSGCGGIVTAMPESFHSV